MKRFRFPLEAVLRYAVHCEEAEETRLQDLLARRLEIDREFGEVRQRQDRSQRERAGLQEISATDNLLFDTYMRRLRRQERELLARRNQVESRIRQQRRRLQEAVRKRRLLDRLRERRLSLHRRESEQAMQREIDDLHLMRAGR